MFSNNHHVRARWDMKVATQFKIRSNPDADIFGIVVYFYRHFGVLRLGWLVWQSIYFIIFDTNQFPCTRFSITTRHRHLFGTSGPYSLTSRRTHRTRL